MCVRVCAWVGVYTIPSGSVCICVYVVPMLESIFLFAQVMQRVLCMPTGEHAFICTGCVEREVYTS